ncbi:hypothetical protein ANO14919_115640 [Xylariales sp. No.14919]|nr:hypothetical protein ANO14919_115640 [Xylariales sp. No.14919]
MQGVFAGGRWRPRDQAWSFSKGITFSFLWPTKNKNKASVQNA